MDVLYKAERKLRFFLFPKSEPATKENMIVDPKSLAERAADDKRELIL